MAERKKSKNESRFTVSLTSYMFLYQTMTNDVTCQILMHLGQWFRRRSSTVLLYKLI